MKIYQATFLVLLGWFIGWIWGGWSSGRNMSFAQEIIEGDLGTSTLPVSLELENSDLKKNLEVAQNGFALTQKAYQNLLRATWKK